MGDVTGCRATKESEYPGEKNKFGFSLIAKIVNHGNEVWKNMYGYPKHFWILFAQRHLDTKRSRKARSVYRNFFKTKEKEVDSL